MERRIAVKKQLSMNIINAWEMPVFYTGIIEEHNAVRTRVGLFDVSHMGELGIRGEDSLSLQER